MRTTLEPWPGKYPIAAFVLAALHSKHHLPSDNELTHSENTLWITCGFWAAAVRGSLRHYLGKCAAERLQVARDAFRDIGASAVVGVLRLHVADLMLPLPPNDIRQLAKKIETQLAHTPDRVDDLIAAYAAANIDSGVL